MIPFPPQFCSSEQNGYRCYERTESDRGQGHLKIKLERWLAISLAMVTL